MTAETDVAARIARQRALALEHAAATTCASLACAPARAWDDARALIEASTSAQRQQAETRARVDAWRARRAAEASATASATAAIERDARTRRAREAREEARERAVRERERLERRDARERERRRLAEDEARRDTPSAGSRAANAMMIAMFQARDAREIAERRDAVEAKTTRAIERELRLHAATARRAPLVARSRERAASWTESAASRARAAALDFERVVERDDLDVFERARRQGWVLRERHRRKAVPEWRTLAPGVHAREY